MITLKVCSGFEGSGSALVHRVTDTCFHLWFGGWSRYAGAPVPHPSVCAVPTSGTNRIPAQLWWPPNPHPLAFLGPESMSRSGMLTQLLQLLSLSAPPFLSSLQPLSSRPSALEWTLGNGSLDFLLNLSNVVRVISQSSCPAHGEGGEERREGTVPIRMCLGEYGSGVPFHRIPVAYLCLVSDDGTSKAQLMGHLKWWKGQVDHPQKCSRHRAWKTPVPHAQSGVRCVEPAKPPPAQPSWIQSRLGSHHCLLLKYSILPSTSDMVHLQGQGQELLLRKSPLHPPDPHPSWV